MYYIYIILCENDKLYTGITTDYKRRFTEHKYKKVGAKFTKSFKPIKIIALYITENRAYASKLESAIKKLTHENKLLIAKNKLYFNKILKDKIETKKYKKISIK